MVEIDDTPCLGLSDQRQQRVGDRDDREEVRLHRVAQDLLGRGARGGERLNHRLAFQVHAGVVDQHVEPAMLAGEMVVGRLMVRLARNVEHERFCCDPFRGERGDRLGAALGATRTDDDVSAELAELAGGLKADAAVAAGDEYDVLVARVGHGISPWEAATSGRGFVAVCGRRLMKRGRGYAVTASFNRSNVGSNSLGSGRSVWSGLTSA